MERSTQALHRQRPPNKRVHRQTHTKRPRQMKKLKTPPPPPTNTKWDWFFMIYLVFHIWYVAGMESFSRGLSIIVDFLFIIYSLKFRGHWLSLPIKHRLVAVFALVILLVLPTMFEGSTFVFRFGNAGTFLLIIAGGMIGQLLIFEAWARLIRKITEK